MKDRRTQNMLLQYSRITEEEPIFRSQGSCDQMEIASDDSVLITPHQRNYKYLCQQQNQNVSPQTKPQGSKLSSNQEIISPVEAKSKFYQEDRFQYPCSPLENHSFFKKQQDNQTNDANDISEIVTATGQSFSKKCQHYQPQQKYLEVTEQDSIIQISSNLKKYKIKLNQLHNVLNQTKRQLFACEALQLESKNKQALQTKLLQLQNDEDKRSQQSAIKLNYMAKDTISFENIQGLSKRSKYSQIDTGNVSLRDKIIKKTTYLQQKRVHLEKEKLKQLQKRKSLSKQKGFKFNQQQRKLAKQFFQDIHNSKKPRTKKVMKMRLKSNKQQFQEPDLNLVTFQRNLDQRITLRQQGQKSKFNNPERTTLHQNLPIEESHPTSNNSIEQWRYQRNRQPLHQEVREPVYQEIQKPIYEVNRLPLQQDMPELIYYQQRSPQPHYYRPQQKYNHNQSYIGFRNNFEVPVYKQPSNVNRVNNNHIARLNQNKNSHFQPITNYYSPTNQHNVQHNIQHTIQPNYEQSNKTMSKPVSCKGAQVKKQNSAFLSGSSTVHSKGNHYVKQSQKLTQSNRCPTCCSPLQQPIGKKISPTKLIAKSNLNNKNDAENSQSILMNRYRPGMELLSKKGKQTIEKKPFTLEMLEDYVFSQKSIQCDEIYCLPPWQHKTSAN